MGVITKTVELCTCDMCGAECDRDDGDVVVQVNSGDGRDVGPAFVWATLCFYQPYRCAIGIVCHTCKIKWLKRYMEQEKSHD